jgi:hypothetical protein
MRRIYSSREQSSSTETDFASAFVSVTNLRGKRREAVPRALKPTPRSTCPNATP